MDTSRVDGVEAPLHNVTLRSTWSSSISAVSPAWKPRLTFFFPGSLTDRRLTLDLRRSSLRSGLDSLLSSENSALAMVVA